MTVKELANELHIKPSTLYAWAGQGRIPFLKLHGLVRFERDAMSDGSRRFGLILPLGSLERDIAADLNGH